MAALTAVLACGVLAGCAQEGTRTNLTISPTPAGAGVPLPVAPSTGGAAGSGARPDGPGGGPQLVETVVTGLDTPWGLGFFPNGDALVTERDTLRVLRVTGRQRVVQEVGTLAQAGGDNAARGVAIAPDFPRSRSVFFYVAHTRGDQVVRARLENGVLGLPQVVVDDIPHSSSGGRIAFGPDDALYVATGSPDDPDDPDDPGADSPAGTILRVTADGEPAPGNPDGSAVWATGLRDVRGLAFDEDQLWALDVGVEVDELDTIESGQDYGWPDHEGPSIPEGGSTDPEVVWDSEVSTPGGLAYVDGRMWTTDLDGERLWAVDVDGGTAGDEDPLPYFEHELGRLRSIARAPDRSLWVTTSDVETGLAGPEEDRILRIEP